MKRIMVCYNVKDGRADENKQLINTVFEELKAKHPAGTGMPLFYYPMEYRLCILPPLKQLMAAIL